MGLLTRVAGSPGSCIDAGRRLARLASVLDDVAGAVRAGRQLLPERFSGDSADVFEAHVARLSPDVRGTGDAVAGFGDALVAYGDRLSEVRAVMRHARTVARGHALLRGSVIALPATPTPHQRTAFTALEPLVAGAWAVLRDAELDLASAARTASPRPLETGPRRFPLATGVPPDADVAADLPVPWPPPASAWPPDTPPDTPLDSSPRPTPHPMSDPTSDPTATAPGGEPVTIHRTAADHELSLSLPRHWPTHDDPGRGIVLAAHSPVVPASGFVPELALRTVALDDLPSPPAGFDVEDTDEFELSGRTVGYERLGHRIGTTDVLTEQWTWIVGDTAVVLTGTVARADYEDYCDVFEDVAATLGITPGGAGPGSVRLAGARW